ncbi:cation:proton antiporter [Kitasatospora sp. NPDC052896]|uniref:cation:proton antiporter n=1 Tax=Kitasatospora sp. NPDC052896 TaxID=3364061 RepID=UPI0037C83922
MPSHLTVVLLLDLALAASLARAAGTVARKLGQPPVIGEVVMGILLGPTLLHGAITRALFPVEVRGFLSAFANLGIALFMFVTGMEFDWSADRSLRRISAGIGLGSIVLPFALGSALGLWWVTGTAAVTPLSADLFMGLALSVTAFPVLARILDDRGTARQPLGRLALASAALCDLVAWLLLAVVLLLGAGAQALGHLLWLPPYLLALAAGVPLLRRLASARSGRLDPVAVLAGLLASCAATEWMGLHFISGAFAFGVTVACVRRSHGEAALKPITDNVRGIGLSLLMPVYFVVAGWQADLSTLRPVQVLQLAVLLAAAVGGKVLGAAGAARLSGLQPRESAVLGVLMNTRGLTELIVLTAGRQAGLLNGAFYSLLVAMAVLTTISTGPVLNLLLGRPAARPAPTAARPAVLRQQA